MDYAGDDVVCDDDQPQDNSEPKTANTLNPEWFTQPLRPPTLDSEWNKRQVILGQPEQPWFNEMVSATKDPRARGRRRRSHGHSYLLLQNLRDLPRDILLVRIEVLRYDERRSKVRKGKLRTKTELTLEQTQQGVSDEVLLFSGIEDGRHGPSDAMHNPPQPLKVRKTIVSKLMEITSISIDFLTPRLLILKMWQLAPASDH
ncbi:hypothetical protein Tco_0066934 [Tanacetum coccineum]